MKKQTLGILGGGQLGMMSAQAARKLGIRTVIYSDEPDSCGAAVADVVVVAPYHDESALRAFADKVDVISYEFENIPVPTVRFLKTIKPVFPDDNLLDIAQDRIQEKTFLNKVGIQTAKWQEIKSSEDIKQVFSDWGVQSLILKTTRFGYDGKGQIKIDSADEAEKAWAQLNSDVLIAEDVIDFTDEISVIVARDHQKNAVHYGPMMNRHKNHILSETLYPSTLSDALNTQAIQMGLSLAEQIDLRGVLCLEMFVTKDGQILANEIAPRTHNSGHLTIDACAVSQFENHVRAVCGLDVLEPQPCPARMINLIGDDILKADEYAAQKNACVHNYGKHDIKPGRKMGHVTFIED